MKTFVVIVSILAVARAQQSSEVVRHDQQDRASHLTQGLYNTLRDVAFPNHKLTDVTASAIEGRFLMLMPGKVLNYFDYFPGNDYTNFIQVSKIEVRIYS
jgi:hypothetical protein